MFYPTTPKFFAVASLVALTSIAASTDASAQVVFDTNIFSQNFNGQTVGTVKGSGANQFNTLDTVSGGGQTLTAAVASDQLVFSQSGLGSADGVLQGALGRSTALAGIQNDLAWYQFDVSISRALTRESILSRIGAGSA